MKMIIILLPSSIPFDNYDIFKGKDKKKTEENRKRMSRYCFRVRVCDLEINHYVALADKIYYP